MTTRKPLSAEKRAQVSRQKGHIAAYRQKEEELNAAGKKLQDVILLWGSASCVNHANGLCVIRTGLCSELG